METKIKQRVRSYGQAILASLRLKSISVSARKNWLLPVLELSMIALLAIWIGREYLDLDLKEVPSGREFMMAIQSHNLWNQLRECGWCAVWNGSTSGGYPAFVDLFGAPLHPIVGLTTLIWGILNGTKMALLASLWLAGLAQWWIARELKVGWIPRMWSAFTVVAGGHLAGRMEAGAFTIMFSTAVASLVIPGILSVHRRGDHRAVILLAIAAASAILAGQGYMQIGLLAALPALVFLLLDEQLKLRPIWRKYVLAGGMTALLAGPFLVPLIHFLPNFSKGLDPSFQAAQPLEYLPLNLVIENFEYYSSGEILGKISAPAPYNLYIGWAPVILAILGTGLTRGENRRRVYYLVAGIILVFLIASGVALEWLMKVFPAVAAVRFPSFIAGLAVPMILGLSAYGLDRLLKIDWPSLIVKLSNTSQERARIISLKWLLIIPLVINLRSNVSFAHAWLFTLHQGDDVPWILEILQTPDLQWVSTPFGEHYFIAPAIEAGLKISPGLKPWGWKERELPTPALGAVRGGPPPGTQKVGESFGISVYAHPDEYYASVVVDDKQQSCVASGSSGHIKVVCNNELPGRLIVKENMWSGWKAWCDGETVLLLDDRWLEVEASAGSHIYHFKYLPWDVPVGLIFLGFGILLSLLLWFRRTGETAEGRSEIKEQQAHR